MEKIKEKLIERGYKITKVREVLMSFFSRKHKPISAQNLAKLIKTIDRASVYRTLNIFENLAWETDEISPTSIQISAIPEMLKVDNLKEVFSDLLSKLKDDKELDMSRRETVIMKYSACRGAIKFGDALSFQEMNALLNQWLETPNNTSCEHGRPVSVRFTVDEMRKFFER